MKRENFKKVVCLGKYVDYKGKEIGDVFAQISFKDEKLSITGVEAPMSNGNARGGAGQIYDSLKNIKTPNENWNIIKIKQFAQVWKRWHLNDMNPGTKEQMDFIKENDEIIQELKKVDSRDDYSIKCDFLKSYTHNMEVIPYYIMNTKYKLIEDTKKIISKLRELKSKAYNIKQFSIGYSDYDIKASIKYLDDDIKWQTIEVHKKYVRNGRKVEELNDIYTYKMQTLLINEIKSRIEKANDIINSVWDDTMYSIDKNRYGCNWYFEEIPQDIYDYLVDLPSTDKRPNWV